MGTLADRLGHRQLLLLGLSIFLLGSVLAAFTTTQRSVQLPNDIPPEIAASATHSIGETMLAAQGLAGAQGQAIIQAGKQAFSTSHSMVLLSAAVLIAILSVVIFFILRNHQRLASHLA